MARSRGRQTGERADMALRWLPTDNKQIVFAAVPPVAFLGGRGRQFLG